MNTKKAICFGEILWDLFPSGKKIGGAPLNVAFRMTQLGIPTTMISAIGSDALGEDLQQAVAEKGVATMLQKKKSFPTGTVDVSLNTMGSAQYTIPMPVAWDHISYTTAIEKKVQEADCFVFGSLVARSPESKETLQRLLPLASYKVFDLNLRKPHYNPTELLEWMQQADLIKCNEEELAELVREYGSNGSDLEQQAAFLAAHTNSSQLCITLGSNGALWYENQSFLYQSGFSIKVKDTVGAGDSFLATLLSGILTDQPMSDNLQNACAIGALVACKVGANPTINPTELINLTSSGS